MKTFIILIILILIIVLCFNKYEYFQVDENMYIEHIYKRKQIDLIENINIDYNNKYINIIPKYISNNKIKLIILNFNNIKDTIDIKINDIFQNIKISDKLTETILTNNNFNFLKKNEKSTMIPKYICQTAKNMNVSINKYLSIRSIIDNNPNYEYNFFDNDKSINFIKQYFNNDVVNAYNTLIPGAYKADLFRYCYLYIKGGVYIDCKMICHINFDDLLENYDIIIVKDIGPEAYWNGFICAKPNLDIFKKCIDNIVDNVKREYYGNSVLDITGPVLFYKNCKLDNLKYKILTFHHIKHGHIDNCIKDDNKKLLSTSYPSYYEENDYRDKNYYDKYWNDKKVYIK
jgi:mannosyltransferase OCH1-like enzyme